MGNMKELKVNMDFCLMMIPGETIEQATERFRKIINAVTASPIEHESAMKVHSIEVQEVG